jgi:hypothetical protein
MSFIRLTPILALAIAVGGCGDAPRDNALDPLSRFFENSATLSGQVTIRNQGTGIPSATVFCLEQAIFVQTDGNGNFSFPQIAAGSVTLICSKEGFVPDTQKTHIDPGSALRLSFSLNGAPIVSNQKIITHKYDQYYPSPQYFVNISASVRDPNGITDVDSVWFAVDTLSFPLSYSITSKLFDATIYKYDFPTNSIQWLVGKPLFIRSRDRSGAIGLSSSFYVSRVIESAGTPTYPTSLNGDTTGSQPVLKWISPSVTFNYSYTIELARVDAGAETTVWIYTQLNSFFSELQFPGDTSSQTLAPGNYVWRISIVDDFGNSSRSKGAFFVVK